MSNILEQGQKFVVTREYVEEILKTLPISYYAGRNVHVELTAGHGTKWNTVTDMIEIDYNDIARTLSKTECVSDLESYIRSLLYHEISHTLLTPTNLLRKEAHICSEDPKLAHDVLNIFEDERIETIMKDVFYGVDFKQAIIDGTGYQGMKLTPPQDALGAFFSIVRFRNDYVEGRTEFTDRVKDIIDKYQFTHKVAYYSDAPDRYVMEIGKLFWDIAKDWMERNQKPDLEQGAGGDPKDCPPNEMEGSGSGSGSEVKVGPKYDEQSESGQKQIVKNQILKESKEAQAKNGGQPGDNGSESGMGGSTVMVSQTNNISNPGNSADPKGKGVEMKGPHPPQGKGGGEDGSEQSGETKEFTEEQLKQLLQDIKDKVDGIDKHKPKRLDDVLGTEFNKFVDPVLTDKIGEIIENFLSRSKNNSSAMMRYSGRLDPRLVGREDWRAWVYKAQHGAIKGYDNLHLNLFIDTSGSYCDNQDETNTILRSLTELEGRYPFFSFDLVTMSYGENLHTKNERCISCGGGNSLDKEIWDIYNGLQDPKSFNYNIVLFDGDAFTDCSTSANSKNFGAFNSNRCTIISDSDNEEYIEKYAPNAHAIIVKNYYRGGSQSYSEMLYDNVLQAFHKALL